MSRAKSVSAKLHPDFLLRTSQTSEQETEFRGLRQPSPIHAHHPAGAQNSQANGHLDTVLNNIELAAVDLVPLDWDLGHLDSGAGANNRAVGSKNRRGGCGFGKHEHLDIEDPALRVHVRYDVGESRTREEFKTALCVTNARRRWWCEDHEHEMKRTHEEVSQGGAL